MATFCYFYYTKSNHIMPDIPKYDFVKLSNEDNVLQIYEFLAIRLNQNKNEIHLSMTSGNLSCIDFMTFATACSKQGITENEFTSLVKIVDYQYSDERRLLDSLKAYNYNYGDIV